MSVVYDKNGYPSNPHSVTQQQIADQLKAAQDRKEQERGAWIQQQPKEGEGKGNGK